MRSIDDIIGQLRTMQPDLRQRYRLREMGVFGSYVRGEQREDSDLDVLVEFDDGTTLLDYAGLQMELSDALGLPVELANKKTLKPRIGRSILAEVRTL
ncbi:nucleotidyltransferase [Paramagnetospirillum caucaseum]|uniref:Nucleotidyltransferase n=1 Tax=Paramagnetospirillum caucaseum TaxID=1244869 RepID=M3AEF3_9PROT|nr:nucleotidyltransferase family protein [Paramagnetospirillum caucaseum]EME71203.1 nucleotidyltransferase [Paramagnetospirillum caucaseum]